MPRQSSRAPGATGAYIDPIVAAVVDLPLAYRSRVGDIVREHTAAERAAVKAIGHAAACGRALVFLKEDLPHGEFTPFVEAHMPFSPQWARGYMRLAEAVDSGRLQIESGLSVSGALKQLAAPKEVEGATRGASAAPAATTYEIKTERQQMIADKAKKRMANAVSSIVGVRGAIEAEAAPAVAAASPEEIDYWDKSLTDSLSAIRHLRNEIRKASS